MKNANSGPTYPQIQNRWLRATQSVNETSGRYHYRPPDRKTIFDPDGVWEVIVAPRGMLPPGLIDWQLTKLPSRLRHMEFEPP